VQQENSGTSTTNQSNAVNKQLQPNTNSQQQSKQQPVITKPFKKEDINQ